MDHSSSPPPLDRRPPAWQRRHWTDPDQPPASSVQPPLPYSPFFPARTPEPQATWQPLFWPDDKIQRLPFVDRSDSSLGETLPGHAPTPLPDTNAPLSPDFHSIEMLLLSDDRSLFGSAPQRTEPEVPLRLDSPLPLPLARQHSLGGVTATRLIRKGISQLINIPLPHATGSTNPHSIREKLTNDLESVVSIYFGKMSICSPSGFIFQVTF